MYVTLCVYVRTYACIIRFCVCMSACTAAAISVVVGLWRVEKRFQAEWPFSLPPASCIAISAWQLVGLLQTYMVKLVVKYAWVRLNASMKYASTLGSAKPKGSVCVSRIRVFTTLPLVWYLVCACHGGHSHTTWKRHVVFVARSPKCAPCEGFSRLLTRTDRTSSHAKHPTRPEIALAWIFLKLL